MKSVVALITIMITVASAVLGFALIPSAWLTAYKMGLVIFAIFTVITALIMVILKIAKR